MGPDPVHSPSLSSVRVSGEFDRRIRLALDHLLAERERILVSAYSPFIAGWGADGVGRWIGAVAAAAAYTGDPIPTLEDTVKEVLHAQQPNGFPDKVYNRYTWFGAARILLGLLEYWKISQAPEVLRSAEKLGQFYLSDFPIEKPDADTWKKHVYPNINHIGGHTEALVALWSATGNSEYLRLAEMIPATIAPDFGEPGGEENGHHTHAFLLEMVGAVELHTATGKLEHLQRAEAVWDHILQKCMWVSGGISELSTSPFETRDEACSVADWLRLSLKLWQATKDPKYMDVAEHTLLNHLYFDQDHCGGFCSYRSIAEDDSGRDRDAVAYLCCSMHGLQALLEAVTLIYTYSDDSIDVNLFAASEVDIPLRNSVVRLRQITAYPSEPSVWLEVRPESECSFCVRIRVPKWSRSVQLTLNDELVEAKQESGYVVMRRNWKSGDVVNIQFEPYLRLVPDRANGFSDSSQAGDMKRIALLYGPLMLMLDRRGEEHGVEILIPQTADGELFLPKAGDAIPARSDVPVAGMCFMTLGRGLDETGKPLSSKDDPWRINFLVPISEITGWWASYQIRPYALRNDVRYVDKEDTEPFLARVNAAFDAHVRGVSASTTGYTMELSRKS